MSLYCRVGVSVSSSAIKDSNKEINRVVSISEVINDPILYFLHQLLPSLYLCIWHFLLLRLNCLSRCQLSFMNTVILKNYSLSWYHFSLFLSHLLPSFLLFFTSYSFSLFHQSFLTILLWLYLFLFNYRLWFLYLRLLFNYLWFLFNYWNWHRFLFKRWLLLFWRLLHFSWTFHWR